MSARVWVCVCVCVRLQMTPAALTAGKSDHFKNLSASSPPLDAQTTSDFKSNQLAISNRSDPLCFNLRDFIAM